MIGEPMAGGDQVDLRSKGMRSKKAVIWSLVRGTKAAPPVRFEWTVLNPADSGSFTYSLARVGQKDSSGNNVVMTAAGWRDTNEAVTALRVHYTSGNISVGYFKLFKRANA